jgi:glucosamine--fructose-6-phosphate aminotransferase (isomerizing)
MSTIQHGSTSPGQWMRSEIAEQPARVAAAFAAVQDHVLPLASVVRDAHQVLLLGRGSSRSASTYAAEAFRSFACVPAYSVSPAQLAWSGTASGLGGTVAIAVSQSGESTEIIAAARQVLKSGGNLIVVTNSADSTLAGLAPAERTVVFHAGREVAVPATKSFTTSLACLLGIATAGQPAALREAAAGIPDLMQRVLTDEAIRFDVAGARNLVCAGEGYAESVGEEGAIKFRETLCRPVTSFETSEFLHGSINSVDADTAVIVVATNALGSHLSDQAVVGAAERGASTVSIGSAESSPAGRHVRLPAAPSHWMPFLAILPLQLAAHDAALVLGLDPDTPRGLSKVTRIQEMSAT